MANKDIESVEAQAYFGTQMAVYAIRGLAAIGLNEEWLQSAVRKTLAEGMEQFSPNHRPALEALAKAFEEAVRGGASFHRSGQQSG